MLEIKEYNDEYKEDVKDLLVELQDYHATIDEQKIMTNVDNYKEEYFNLVYNEIIENEGKIFLALKDSKVIGLTACLVDSLPFGHNYVSTCPKRGRILKLIIKENERGQSIGSALLEKVEDYLKSIDCKYIDIDVFGTNKAGLEFYLKKGYIIRTYKIIKEI